MERGHSLPVVSVQGRLLCHTEKWRAIHAGSLGPYSCVFPYSERIHGIKMQIKRVGSDRIGSGRVFSGRMLCGLIAIKTYIDLDGISKDIDDILSSGQVYMGGHIHPFI